MDAEPARGAGLHLEGVVPPDTNRVAGDLNVTSADLLTPLGFRAVPP
jgi:hypothetical protein